jgi:ketosteroid isomerase-like protein
MRWLHSAFFWLKRARNLLNLHTVNATGKRFDLPLVHVWTIQNGKVKRFLNFTDTARAAEAYMKN